MWILLSFAFSSTSNCELFLSIQFMLMKVLSYLDFQTSKKKRLYFNEYSWSNLKINPVVNINSFGQNQIAASESSTVLGFTGPLRHPFI